MIQWISTTLSYDCVILCQYASDPANNAFWRNVCRFIGKPNTLCLSFKSNRYNLDCNEFGIEVNAHYIWYFLCLHIRLISFPPILQMNFLPSRKSNWRLTVFRGSVWKYCDIRWNSWGNLCDDVSFGGPRVASLFRHSSWGNPTAWFAVKIDTQASLKGFQKPQWTRAVRLLLRITFLFQAYPMFDGSR